MLNSTTSKNKIKESSAWLLTPFLMLTLNPSHVLAQAFNNNITIDGAGLGGTFVGSTFGGPSTVSVSNKNFTNFLTIGGAGSGGGGGLGGVFFVDQNATLNLNNVQLSSNVARGGTGGSVAQIALADVNVNLVNLNVDVTSITAPSSTPTVTYNGTGYEITRLTMAGANSLIATGASVSFGSAVVGTGTISSVAGLEVTLLSPVAVDPTAVKNLAVTATGNARTFSVTGSSFGPTDLAQGMVVFGGGVKLGTITAVTYDSQNAVSSITLSDNVVGNPTNFDVIPVTSFDATRFSIDPNHLNQIRPTTGVGGLQVGMAVTGNGIPDGTTITAIASNGLITLSQPILSTATAFKASLTAATLGSNTITLASARSDLARNMVVSGTGIPDGTTITDISGSTLTLSNNVSADTIAAIASGTMSLSTSRVLSSTSNTIALASVAGIKVGALLTGNGVPTNAVVTGINASSKVVTYRVDANAANLTTGGVMNSLPTIGSVGYTGASGLAASMYNAVLHDGEGQAGTNAYNAGDGNNAAGGKGGDGGNGSRGLPYNLDAMSAVTSSTLGALKDTMEMAADAAPDPFPKVGLVAVKVGALVMDWYDVAVATADLIKWQVDLGMGLVAHGGDGGAGGSGGNGSTFFGGGQGGKGGNGGTGATPITDGGAGGEGGSGGAGGFGAGGGAGGKGGAGGANGSSVNGGAGSGGDAGFGGGSGSTGDGNGGGGGSGFGGAIFVRDGGTLSITGNALFENNAVLAGSSTNKGSAGEAAGTDLFMMRGSNVTLSPGVGNTITFRGTIADDSAASIGGQWASGEGADIQITGGGLVQFEGANTYTGRTMIGGGTLQAADGMGIHTDSQIWFNGMGSVNGTPMSEANAGVLLTSGDFNRRVGDLPNQVFWAGSGGFAAEEAGLTLNFGAIGNTARQTLVWNANGFVPADKTLVFGSAFGTGVVTLVNDVNLNGLTGRIAVYDNTDVTTDYAVLQGNFSNGSLIFNDAGYSGTTYMTGQSSLTSLTVQSGLLDTQLGSVTGRLFDPTAGGDLTVTGGTVNLRGAEKINNLSIADQAHLVAFDAITAGDINNSGSLTLNGGLTANDVTNTLTGSLMITGGTALSPNAVRDITNSGAMWIGAPTTARNILNNAPQVVGGVLTGGVLMVTDNVTASGTVGNDGTFGLAANLTAGGSVTNNGVLSILGDLQSDHSEAAATRTITTTGFAGSSSSFVNLGGANTHVHNTLNIAQSGDSTYDGVISGAGSLVKQGLGTLTLTGHSTFTGGLTITGGGINTTGGGTLADTLAVTVGQLGSYTVGTTDTIASLSNSGTTNISTGKTLALTGDLTNTATGVMTVAGMLQVGGNTQNTLGGVLNINTGASAYLTGNLNNPGTINNSGVLAVGGLTTNTSPHTLNMAAASATTLNALNNTGNVIGNGATFTVTNAAANGVGGTMSLNAGTNVFGSLSNSGAIAVGATGGTLAVTGAYVQNAGTLSTTTNMSTGSLSGAGGTITLTGANTHLAITQTANGTYSGSVTGTGTVDKYGSATLTLNGGVNSFAPAALNINAGAVAVDGAGILANALRVDIVTGASLNLVSGDQSINNLSGAGTLNLGANNLTLAQGGTFMGSATGSGAVRVTSGAFTVASGGSMGTSGVMNVTGGSSTLNAAGTLTAGTLNVNDGGTLHLGTPGGAASVLNTDTLVVSGGGSLTGEATIRGLNGGNNTIVIGSGGTLAPGNSPGVMTLVGDVTLASGSFTDMQVEGLTQPGGSNGFDQAIVTGKLTLSAGSTLNVQKLGFEFGLAEKAQIFNFAPGKVSGYFGTVNSDFTRSVIFNVPTGTVIGLGNYTATTFTNAISTTPNQAAIVKALMVNNAGGVNQYYGGRLMEYVTAALATSNGAMVKQAFDRWSPEAYTGMMDQMKFSMLNNMPELGGYTNLVEGSYTPYGSVKRLGQSTSNSAGYVQSNLVDNNANVGVAYQSSIGQFTFGYTHSDGSLKSTYMKGSAIGEKVTVGASLPFALAGNLRATTRLMFGTYGMSGTRETNNGKASFGNVRGNTLVYAPGLEYAKDFGNIKLNATTEVLGMQQRMPGFTEAGVSALDAMTVHDQTSSTVSIKGDVRLGYMINEVSSAYLKTGVIHQFDNNTRSLTANAKSDAVNFNVQNPGLGASQFTAGLGANLYLSKKALFSLDMVRGTGGLSNIDLSFKYMFN